ncbi:MAG: hypothetical protein PHV74_07720 [Dehalococcoidia bacterium]|nr:hypothetical protein [Dehalococcoidia bacterium]
MAISRIDSRNTHGWSVRVARGSKKHGTWKEINGFFSDKKWGGRDIALQQAREYEVKLLIENPEMEPAPFKEFPQANCSTGVCGVSRTFKRCRRNRDILYWGYAVLYKTADGRRATKFFSENKYGEDEAFERAVAFRKEWEKQVKRKGAAVKRTSLRTQIPGTALTREHAST